MCQIKTRSKAQYKTVFFSNLFGLKIYAFNHRLIFHLQSNLILIYNNIIINVPSLFYNYLLGASVESMQFLSSSMSLSI